MREEVIARVSREKIIAIVRGVGSEQCMNVAKALYAGGVRLMEVTYDQSRPESWGATAKAIGDIARAFGDKMLIGAGTVTEPALVDMTRDAGGLYVISPDTNTEVIKRTRELGLVSMPGALTPSEIMMAHRSGADFVKLFPAADMGPGYLKAVRAPLNHQAHGGRRHKREERLRLPRGGSGGRRRRRQPCEPRVDRSGRIRQNHSGGERARLRGRGF